MRNELPLKLHKQSVKMLDGQAINPRRRAEKIEMAQLGFTNKKRYRGWQKDQRRLRKMMAVTNV